MDVSYYAAIKEQYEDSRIVLGQLFLDNYDEVTKVMNDKDLSNLDNFITNTLSDWAREFEIFLKRVDDDHFFILAYTGALKKLEEEKFKILDVIRERTSKRNSPLTLSVGTFATFAKQSRFGFGTRRRSGGCQRNCRSGTFLRRQDQSDGKADACPCADDFPGAERTDDAV